MFFNSEILLILQSTDDRLTELNKHFMEEAIYSQLSIAG